MSSTKWFIGLPQREDGKYELTRDEICKLLDDYEAYFKQNSHKHSVSGSDPLYQLAKEIGFENVSEDDLQKVIDKTKGLRSASGAAGTVAERRISKHVCGAQGYNPMLGDTCEGCENERSSHEGQP